MNVHEAYTLKDYYHKLLELTIPELEKTFDIMADRVLYLIGDEADEHALALELVSEVLDWKKSSINYAGVH